MTWLLKLLLGKAGPFIAGAFAITLALSTATACVQTKRLEKAKAEVASETARADVNYARALEWRELVIGKNGWKAAYGRLEARRSQETADFATAIEAASQARAAASSAAFDRGYAAGRVAGRLSCGVNDASPADPARPGPGRVRDEADDLRSSWGRSAYRPG